MTITQDTCSLELRLLTPEEIVTVFDDADTWVEFLRSSDEPLDDITRRRLADFTYMQLCAVHTAEHYHLLKLAET